MGVKRLAAAERAPGRPYPERSPRNEVIVILAVTLSRLVRVYVGLADGQADPPTSNSE